MAETWNGCIPDPEVSFIQVARVPFQAVLLTFLLKKYTLVSLSIIFNYKIKIKQLLNIKLQK